jgi:hypothetical protein
MCGDVRSINRTNAVVKITRKIIVFLYFGRNWIGSGGLLHLLKIQVLASPQDVVEIASLSQLGARVFFFCSQKKKHGALPGNGFTTMLKPILRISVARTVANDKKKYCYLLLHPKAFTGRLQKTRIFEPFAECFERGRLHAQHFHEAPRICVALHEFFHKRSSGQPRGSAWLLLKYHGERSCDGSKHISFRCHSNDGLLSGGECERSLALRVASHRCIV